jgi:hypothetical protein
MTPRGIYFADRHQDRRPAFFFFDFATQGKALVAVPDSGRVSGRLDVSADGRWLLAAIRDEGNADLKLIEGFR